MSLASYAEKFTHYCRTGQLDPSLEINRERLNVYLHHVRNKIDMSLKWAFPLTHHLLTAVKWKEVAEAFIAQVECSTPFFWMMPQSFVHFVKNKGYGNEFNIPYLDDLLHFEWIEIELFRMADLPQESCLGIVLNSESMILEYSYPVFEKKPLPREMKKGIYSLLAFRHPVTKQVHFISLSRFFRLVLELLKAQSMEAEDALEIAAEHFKLDVNQALIQGQRFLKDLIDQGALYGTV